jgi:stage II sporulation protein D
MPSSAIPEKLDGVVRVGLTAPSGETSVSIAFTGKTEVQDLSTSRRVGNVEARSLVVSLSRGEVKCPALSLSSPEGFRFVPAPQSLFRIGSRSYRGAVEAWRNGSKLTVVNEADLEDYVYGALLLEGGSSLHPEAQKALAVAIRTYAERNRGKHGDLYDVCDTTHCQGYAGVKAETQGWARRAQQATAGEILTWNDEPIWSLYSTDCGGATANNEDAGVGDTACPYLRGVSAEDGHGRDFCAASPYHHWTAKASLARLENLLNRQPQTRIGHLTKIAVDRQDRFGRAVTVRFEGIAPAKTAARNGASHRENSLAAFKETSPASPGVSTDGVSPTPPAVERSARILKASALRTLLGLDVLKSTFFTVSQDAESVTFTGKGYGHGVGMCQFGANGMAKAGIGYRDILARYYTGVSLVQLYETLPEGNASTGTASTGTASTGTASTGTANAP